MEADCTRRAAARQDEPAGRVQQCRQPPGDGVQPRQPGTAVCAQAMALLDDMLALEELVADALQDQHSYAWPWRWSLGQPAVAPHTEARRTHLQQTAGHVRQPPRAAHAVSARAPHLVACEGPWQHCCPSALAFVSHKEGNRPCALVS